MFNREALESAHLSNTRRGLNIRYPLLLCLLLSLLLACISSSNHLLFLRLSHRLRVWISSLRPTWALLPCLFIRLFGSIEVSRGSARFGGKGVKSVFTGGILLGVHDGVNERILDLFIKYG